MKLMNIYVGDEVHTGLVTASGVHDLATSGLWTGPVPVSVWSLKNLKARLEDEEPPAAMSIDTFRVAPVSLKPEKIICVGLNYRRHAIEAKMAIPTTPVIFAKYANTLSGHRAMIELPRVDFKFDYEAELGVVIGDVAKDVSVDDALNYVAGYCCANDLSARGSQLDDGKDL
jgi:2-keto-4-pentenoate hydratase/2-oxohepta-3-ene-1,7-dioic acid hydratase in catechol pathway